MEMTIEHKIQALNLAQQAEGGTNSKPEAVVERAKIYSQWLCEKAG